MCFGGPLFLFHKDVEHENVERNVKKYFVSFFEEKIKLVRQRIIDNQSKDLLIECSV